MGGIMPKKSDIHSTPQPLVPRAFNRVVGAFFSVTKTRGKLEVADFINPAASQMAYRCHRETGERLRSDSSDSDAVSNSSVSSRIPACKTRTFRQDRVRTHRATFIIKDHNRGTNPSGKRRLTVTCL
jgi:hypothetical protein